MSSPAAARPTAAYVALALLFLLALTNWVRDTRDRVHEMLHGDTLVGAPFDINPVLRASGLGPQATEAGMRDDDRVLAVDGRPLEGISGYHGALRRARAGDTLWVRVSSDTSGRSGERDLAIQPPGFSYLGFRQGDTSAYVYIVLFRIAIPLFCLGLGFWVAAARVRDKAAWLLLFLMLGFANTILDTRTIYGNEDALQPLLTGYALFFSGCFPITLALFAIAFPEPLPIDRRFPWIKWLLFGPLIAFYLFRSVLISLSMHHAGPAALLWPLFLAIEWLVWLVPVALVIFFGVLGYKTITASGRDARRRLLLLDASAVASVVPIALLVVLSLTHGVAWQGWTGVIPMVMLLIFPLTMAYVIVVHRAMDVRVVMRQGVQYLFARGGIRAMQIVLMVVVSIAAASLLSGGTSPGRVAIVVAGMPAIVAISGRFVDRLRNWVDRRFFREAYESDAILSELATQVRTMVETGPLLETVATRVATSLHVPRIAILLNGQGGLKEGAGAFRPAYALGYGDAPALSLAADSATVGRLRQQPHALVRFDDADSWVHQTSAEERSSLAALQSELLLPLALNEQLLGIMSLGPKQSEEPFSRTDLRLLDSVAMQTGLALENGRLTAVVAEQVAARAKEKRDLEIAREVQERLFPQDYPPFAGLDYAGMCRPARGVGGDYYDFIPLPNAQLGLAIGDVSGKGIPAALLMATLRAYLRGAQTIHHQTDLAQVMQNLNRLVYESSSANRYVTFFYGELDAATRVLRYVNGGHNPPMLFRPSADGGIDVQRLETGGPVIGLIEECVYAQGCVTLAPGDLLVAYTDGVSEAMNAADEEWGEEALMAEVREGRDVEARALMTRIIGAANRFAAGAPQHDDMTAVVLRVLG